ncbi:MAG: DUF2868 domain-containing protein, partial [Pseudomonadota bacterium]|nr:DUF2868 domain-containing protein [Pseudomonadota bacterium]
LYVVLPRGLLALGADLRARWLARHFPLSLDEPYFQRLARQQRGDVARVRIQPYAWTPGEPAAAWLQHALAPILGDGLHVDLAPDAPFGAEDEASEPIPTGTTHVVVLFDLAATPEPEHHGRFLRALAARTAQGVPTVVMVDETSFSRRFGRDSTRLVQRRDAWRQFTAALGSVPVYIDVDAPDPGATGPAIQLALRNPVTPS